MKLDKYLRMRSTWLVIYPLTAFILISIISNTSTAYILPVFIHTFPLGILIGAGFSENTLKYPEYPLLLIGWMVAFFCLYALFVVRIKKFGVTALRVSSFLLIVALILGIKGCALIVSHARM